MNVEFAEITGENAIRMRVWERGSGITMACGTGACAIASAAVSKGLCEFDKTITVELDGGILEITVSREYKVTMTGPAERPIYVAAVLFPSTLPLSLGGKAKTHISFIIFRRE